jgi:uncharacterized linocin/CFP29 family protein
MSDYSRWDAVVPTEEQILQLHNEAGAEARRILVGRRIIHIWGPLRVGSEVARHMRFGHDEPGRIARRFVADSEPISALDMDLRPLPVLARDFVMTWREVEYAKEHGVPLDPTLATRAAHMVADMEDRLIFQGDADLGMEGLLSVPDRNHLAAGDWDTRGEAYADVVRAIELLLSQDHHGPFAAVTSPKLYHKLHVARDVNVLEADQIRRVCDAGLFRTPVLADDQAVVLSTGKQNFDLAVGQDLSVTYLGPELENHPFRVFETLALRVKRPGAVCALTAG